MSAYLNGAACCALLGVALGGDIITRDLAIILKTSLEEAAGLKERSEVMACRTMMISCCDQDVKGQVEQRFSS